jgi:hypothetical protein
MLAMLLASLRGLLATMSGDFDLACFRISLFLAILYINITESSFLRGDHHLWFVMQLCIWMVPRAAAPSVGRVKAQAMEQTFADSPSG